MSLAVPQLMTPPYALIPKTVTDILKLFPQLSGLKSSTSQELIVFLRKGMWRGVASIRSAQQLAYSPSEHLRGQHLKKL